MTAAFPLPPEGALIVSCQPVDDGPMDRVPIIVAMALAARDGGAMGLRIEGAENVAAVTRACSLPVVGIVKRDLPDSPVRITPFLEDVAALARAGARIIAVDATDRPRPVPVADLLAAIRAEGCLAMADLATLAEARAARDLGFDIIGTTMSGYTGGPVPATPDLALVTACRALGGYVVAEGRYNSPELAARAIRAGANALCTGSAITRQEHVTGWFRDAVTRAARAKAETVLALDIGGTKAMAALVRDGAILDRRVIATPPGIGDPEWFAALAGLGRGWEGRYSALGAAVTGLVAEGRWNALNPATLAIPADLPLTDRLRDAFGLSRVVAANDAQAAAWGEYRRGAGDGRDMMFLTVSSGIGGGLVLDGRLRTGARGLAGSLGQVADADGTRLESRASGFAMAAAAAAAGLPGDTRALFAAAADGNERAAAIIDAAAAEVATALVNLQKLVDVDVFVLGGGIGLLPAFRERVLRRQEGIPALLRPSLVPAALGADAGIVGAADLAAES